MGYLAAAMLVIGPAMLSATAHAGSLSAKDLQIVTKVLGFLDPPCLSGVVAVVFAQGNPASEADATRVAALFGAGPNAGNSIRAEAVSASALQQDKHYVAVILSAGVPAGSVSSYLQEHHVLCITGDLAQVEAGLCVLSVQSDPRVEIVLNRALAASYGIGFATAFRMLIHEI
jgi:hypothetical protein